MTQRAHEINFDGLVGPAHNYAGLAVGNLASQRHKQTVSNPKAAALQGLAKMKLMADLGVKQAVLPPQERPNVAMLRRLGFDVGGDAEVLQRAARDAPQLLAACASASSMWAANAATVSPSPDTADGRVHFTAANLVSHLHRSMEAQQTSAVLHRIFADESRFCHHGPLPATAVLSDEGAANHTRLCRRQGEPGVELFVFGECSTLYPARQSRYASQTIARLHQLDPQRTIFAMQSPEAINAGVFHNDVIAVGNENVLLYHRCAFVDSPALIDQLRRAFETYCQGELISIEVGPDELSLDEAVTTYLFNSQLLTLPDGDMTLICPTECQDHPATGRVLDRIVQETSPVSRVHYVNTRESMHNGGGPACLRLRVVLTDDELGHVHRGVLFTDALYQQLIAWVQKHYRDRLTADDLADPCLLHESRTALDELFRILDLTCRC